MNPLCSHLSPLPKRGAAEGEGGDRTLESCKSRLACRSFLVIILYEGNHRVVLDLQKPKHKIHVSKLFLMKT